MYRNPYRTAGSRQLEAADTYFSLPSACRLSACAPSLAYRQYCLQHPPLKVAYPIYFLAAVSLPPLHAACDKIVTRQLERPLSHATSYVCRYPPLRGPGRAPRNTLAFVYIFGLPHFSLQYWKLGLYRRVRPEVKVQAAREQVQAALNHIMDASVGYRAHRMNETIRRIITHMAFRKCQGP